MRNSAFCAIVLITIIETCCFGAGEPAVVNKPGVGLTIYNDNFAVVREARNMKFDKGQNTVRFTDVASAIDPTSVKFSCLSAPGAVSVLEQNYEYDLISTDKLLGKYLGILISLFGIMLVMSIEILILLGAKTSLFAPVILQGVFAVFLEAAVISAFCLMT